LVDGDRDADAFQEIDYAMMEVGNCLRLQRKFPFLAPASARDQSMADEVELDLEDFAAGRDRRGAKSACGNIEGDLPTVVEPRRQRQPDFTYDLSPELQCCGCVAPASIGQMGPNGDGIVHGLLLSRRIFRPLARLVVAPRGW